jgi:hypothetical protein
VRAWTDAIRAGHYAQANALFALPSTIENGTRIHATLRAEIDVFNRSLPCGAILTHETATGGGRVEATFRLVAGPGGPCRGAAKVRFRILRGRITEWIRESTGPPPGSTET